MANPIQKYFFSRMLKKIENADEDEITQITAAVIRRYNRKFPDWDVSFLSLSKDPAARKQELESLMSFYENLP